jgi:hypothetical protein
MVIVGFKPLDYYLATPAITGSGISSTLLEVLGLYFVFTGNSKKRFSKGITKEGLYCPSTPMSSLTEASASPSRAVGAIQKVLQIGWKLCPQLSANR